MKNKNNLFIAITILILSITTTGSAQEEGVCTGTLGDVKYSILQLADFQRENGDCWQRMDGNIVADSKLNAKYGIVKLPDSRGAFIRVQDNRADNDPNRLDFDRKKGDPIGTFQDQDQSIKSYTLEADSRYVLADTGKISVSENNGWSDFTVTGEGDSDGLRQAIKFKLSSKLDDSEYEVRPKNITLYMYVRIN